MKCLFGEGQIVALEKGPVLSESKKEVKNEKFTVRLNDNEELIRSEEPLRIQKYSYNNLCTTINHRILTPQMNFTVPEA